MGWVSIRMCDLLKTFSFVPEDLSVFLPAVSAELIKYIACLSPLWPDSHSSHKFLSQSRVGEMVWPVVMVEIPNTPWVFKNLLLDHGLQEASDG